MSPAAMRKKALFTLAAAGIGIVVALFLAEGIVRLANLAPGLNRVATDLHRLSNNPILKYELIPFSYHGYEAINQQGRRILVFSEGLFKNCSARHKGRVQVHIYFDPEFIGDLAQVIDSILDVLYGRLI